MSGATRIVAAARAMVGVPFRLHGRSEAGVDCVGLAVVALGRAGQSGIGPVAYGLRSGDVGLAERWLGNAGLVRVDQGAPGDLALVRPGPLQLHLMILVPGGFVHAHAGLRRVVEMPGASPWPVIGWWRAEWGAQR
ncbi:cell wall-associated NlpC family hydrolase [Sphingobium xenophagum]|uniref:Cell wall-associated NlpC family hydrolase n=1 Tax=Sphingobium xenophagum TaxID=121428 RepID=A0ABU1X2J9_SPHXE|nr:peptidoglycan endopeptidase [Sphingobium xenophagum]MDR7155499.1 cell wall-associated NlpC family hydrolase [Sphingobium xenophagum]